MYSFLLYAIQEHMIFLGLSPPSANSVKPAAEARGDPMRGQDRSIAATAIFVFMVFPLIIKPHPSSTAGHALS
jgi:hypothetical protein